MAKLTLSLYIWLILCENDLSVLRSKYSTWYWRGVNGMTANQTNTHTHTSNSKAYIRLHASRLNGASAFQTVCVSCVGEDVNMDPV